MKPEYENRISSYLNHEMDDEERRAFEEACRQDDDLRVALKAELKVRMAIHEYAKKKRRSFYDHSGQPDLARARDKPSASWGTYLKMAALFLMILVPGYIVYLNLKSPDMAGIYESHFQPYALTVERDFTGGPENVTDSLWQVAGQAYRSGDWKNSKSALYNLLDSKSFAAADLTRLLLANIALEEDNPGAAIDLLKKVDRDNLTLRYDVSWYLTLAYLKSGSRDSVLMELEILKSSKEYGRRAKEIRKRL